MRVRVAVGVVCAGAAAGAETTPNRFLRGATPTFVVGTRGDALADRIVAGQVELVRGMLFPEARVVADTAIAAEGWPARPVLYGGPHVNAALAALELPFLLGPGRLEIAGRVFEGDGFALIAVVPAGARHPELLVFAGTGTPGVAEINSGIGGDEPVVVADAFGWLAGGDLRQLSAPARRIAWREVERGGARVRSPAMLPPPANPSSRRARAGSPRRRPSWRWRARSRSRCTCIPTSPASSR
jgi:hypothetical protein